MHDSITKQNAEFYNSEALTYDQTRYSNKEGKRIDRFQKRILDEFLVDCDVSNFSVLEVGCGTGRFLTFMAEKGATVTGIDISSEMLKIAAARIPVEADVMNSGAARLIHKEETLYRTRPHWSPDGKRIVYSSHLGHQYVNLFVLPVVGGEPYKMTFGEHDSFHPRWSPDGEWLAYISNEEGLPQLKILKSWGGREQLMKISSKRWNRPMGTVTVRVVDEDGRETPARIYQTAADGKAYTPSDSYERISSLGEHLFHTPGSFTTEVPAGTYTVEAVKGFEYFPAQKFRRACGSSPVVGSSRKMSLGRLTSATASNKRCR